MDLPGCNRPATHTAAEARTLYSLYYSYALLLVLVDGGWSDWSPGECSVTCGGGERNLTRTCTNPTPSCNGSVCPGEDLRTEKCNMQCCLGAIKHLTDALIM